MEVTVVGAGHVGLVAGACLAEIGHNVVCVDSNADKIKELRTGQLPFYEPGLHDLLSRNEAARRVSYTTSLREAIQESEVVFLCVGTPATEAGEANMYYVDKVATEIAPFIGESTVIVEKSTVPVRTGANLRRCIQRIRPSTHFEVVSNPEFLREGTAVNDFLFPDRIVLGVESDHGAEVMKELYEPIVSQSFELAHTQRPKLSSVPVIVTSVSSAELIKHAANSFLALKISYINAIANVCELAGADVIEVARGLGLDKRIGSGFLSAGAGYGGYCLPKDVSAFHAISKELGYDFALLQEVEAINQHQKLSLVEKTRRALWVLRDKTIGVLGLAFKPDTDDMRCAPSLDIVRALQAEGAKVRAYDPQAMHIAKVQLPGVTYCNTAYDAAGDCHALLVITEWNEFAELDLVKLKDRMRLPIIVDGRNMFCPTKVQENGFEYYPVGRRPITPAETRS